MSRANPLAGISYEELRAWLKLKAHEHSSWRLIVVNESIFKAAHMFAAQHMGHPPDLQDPNRLFGLEAFKQFLIHLFVLSVIFVHFKKADSWSEGNGVGKSCLNLEEFKVACRKFVSADTNESLTEEKIVQDFRTLDTNGTGAIDFLEVVLTFYFMLCFACFASAFCRV